MAAITVMQLRLVAVLGACVLGTALPQECVGRVYVNDEFGILVGIPDRYRFCASPPPMPDRGFSVLLRGGACEDDNSPSVSFSLSYNASLEHRTTGEVARDWCRPKRATWSVVKVAGLRMMECPQPRRGGFERHLYVGLRARPEAWFGQWTVVAIFVRCDRAMRRDCAAAVGELVRGVRWRE